MRRTVHFGSMSFGIVAKFYLISNTLFSTCNFNPRFLELLQNLLIYPFSVC